MSVRDCDNKGERMWFLCACNEDDGRGGGGGGG